MTCLTRQADLRPAMAAYRVVAPKAPVQADGIGRLAHDHDGAWRRDVVIDGSVKSCSSFERPGGAPVASTQGLCTPRVDRRRRRGRRDLRVLRDRSERVAKGARSSAARLQQLRAGPLPEQVGVGERRERAVHRAAGARGQLHRPRLPLLHVVAASPAPCSRDAPAARTTRRRRPARLAVAIDEAKALHLRVFLRPILNETRAERGARLEGDHRPEERQRVVPQLPQGPHALPEARPRARGSTGSPSRRSSTACRRSRTGRGSSRARSGTTGVR